MRFWKAVPKLEKQHKSSWKAFQQFLATPENGFGRRCIPGGLDIMELPPPLMNWKIRLGHLWKCRFFTICPSIYGAILVKSRGDVLTGTARWVWSCSKFSAAWDPLQYLTHTNRCKASEIWYRKTTGSVALHLRRLKVEHKLATTPPWWKC